MNNKSNNYHVAIGGAVTGNLTVGENNRITTIYLPPDVAIVDLQELAVEIQSLHEDVAKLFPKNSSHNNLQETKEAICQNERLMEKLRKLSIKVGVGAIVEAIGQPLGNLLTEILN
jgi:hypothetical protein